MQDVHPTNDSVTGCVSLGERRPVQNHRPAGRTCSFAFVLTCLILIVPRHSPASPPIVDVEPNNVVNSAQATGLLNDGTVMISGLINDWRESGSTSIRDRGRDPDLFSIVLTDAARFPILLTARFTSLHPDLDGRVRAFTRCPNLPAYAMHIAAARDSDATHPDAVLYTYFFRPGTYYVGVSGSIVIDPNIEPFGSSGLVAAATGQPYELEIDLAPAPRIEGTTDPDPNLPVNPHAYPFHARNQLLGDGPDPLLDIDGYFIRLTRPSIITVEAAPTVLPALDPDVFVDVGPGGGRFHLTNELRTDERTLSIRLAVFQPGFAGVGVRGIDWALGSPCSPAGLPSSPPHNYYLTTGYSGYYDLSIDVEPMPRAAGPYEPNDSVFQAAPSGVVGPGHARFHAFVGDGLLAAARGDIDFFVFDLGLDQLLDFHVVPDAATDALLPVVHLYDSLGRRLQSFEPDERGDVAGTFQRTCTDALTPPAAAPETYYLAVTGAGTAPPADPFVPASPAGQYPAPMVLSQADGGSGSTGDYRLEMAVTEHPLPRCGLEPDDSTADAPVVLVDEGEYACVEGRIGDGSCPSAGSDVDLIAIRVDSAPASLDVRLNSTLCGSFEGKLVRLFDAAGVQLAVANVTSVTAIVKPLSDSVLRVILDQPGIYHLGISDPQNTAYDPMTACSGAGTVFEPFDRIKYELHVCLLQTRRVPPELADDAGDTTAAQDRVFAAAFDPAGNEIHELDADSGEVIATLPVPEARVFGSRGLAFDGDDLFVLDGDGRYPLLLRVSAETGKVLERVRTWFGSGAYGAAVAVGKRLYISDLLRRAVYVLPTSLTGPVARLDFGARGLVALHGPVAATVMPNRLIAPDATDAGTLHVFDAATGSVVGDMALNTACLCDADLDRDGDIDDADAAILADCNQTVAGVGVPFGCRPADLNCDELINAADTTIFNCLRDAQFRLRNGRRGECCPADLPRVGVRATALTGTGNNELVAADWNENDLHRYDVAGAEIGIAPVDLSIAHLAGHPSLDVPTDDPAAPFDLLDWARLQTCYGTSVGPTSNSDCATLDFDTDADIDAADLLTWTALTEARRP
ncbi:MAG: hypothetical protein HOP29_04060 [Phycisphaerales bacterium]|nr:hypothetical protein [Phycisphaerales bacterium]